MTVALFSKDRNSSDDHKPPLQHYVRRTPHLGVLRQVVRDYIPGRAIVNESVKLWPDTRIVIEGAHSDRYLGAIRPIAPKHARAADSAKSFHGSFPFAVDANEVVARKEFKLFAPNTGLRANGGSGMFPTTFAVAMAGP